MLSAPDHFGGIAQDNCDADGREDPAQGKGPPQGSNRDALDAQVSQVGGLLFRNFSVPSVG